MVEFGRLPPHQKCGATHPATEENAKKHDGSWKLLKMKAKRRSQGCVCLSAFTQDMAILNGLRCTLVEFEGKRRSEHRSERHSRRVPLGLSIQDGYKPCCSRKAFTTVAVSFCSASTCAFILRISSAVILPPSSARTARSSGNFSSVWWRTTGTAS